MNQKIVIAVLALLVIVEFAAGAYGASRIKTLQAELADSKTRVVEKLVVDHNGVQCVR